MKPKYMCIYIHILHYTYIYIYMYSRLLCSNTRATLPTNIRSLQKLYAKIFVIS